MYQNNSKASTYRRQDSPYWRTMERCHRQLPACMLTGSAVHKVGDTTNSFSYWQALCWVKEKQICLKTFIDILRLYPKIIQNNAYDSFWNFILPLLSESTSDTVTVCPVHSHTNSQVTTSKFHTDLASTLHTNNAQFGNSNNVTAAQNSSDTFVSISKNKSLLGRMKKSEKNRNFYKKSFLNIPTIFVSTEPTADWEIKNNHAKMAYSSKVFVCRDPNNIEDIMNTAVLSSVSSISFLHCMAPTMQLTDIIIPECNAFIFIINEFTISSTECLSQLKQANALQLPILFVRYPDFQLPYNIREIIEKSFESTSNLDQYLSLRRRSFVTSSNSSKYKSISNGYSCFSDRETSPSSPLPPRKKTHKKLLPLFPSSNSDTQTFQMTVDNVISCLEEGYNKAQLYNYNSHVSCISQIIDSISNILGLSVSYDTSYFQQKKNTSDNKSFELQHDSMFYQSSRRKVEKQKKVLTEKTSENSNVILAISNPPEDDSKTKWSYQRKKHISYIKKDTRFDANTVLSSTDLTCSENALETTTNPTCCCESSDISKLSQPQDNSTEESPCKVKETSYVVFPGSKFSSNKKPIVIKLPPPWNHLDSENIPKLQEDETDSLSSINFFDVDLSKELYSQSDEDFF